MPSFWSSEGADFVGPETCTILDVVCKEKKTYKITDVYMYNSDYLFGERKESTTNYKSEKTVKCHKYLKKCLYYLTA